MALFQSSVLKDHLRLQDVQQVDKAYKTFTSFFQNPEIQENIRSSKEEQFQATFLNELFVKVLGYTMNPQPGYDLTTEFKNQKNARKADGALLKDGLAIGVIELKGTNTKHLEGIRQQAFDYKANQKGCVYVVTSNFEKLRFYINDATEFEEFDLFELNREDFSLLYLCLHKDNIFSHKPLKIKEASLVEEEVITKQFYKDYSVFKRELFGDLVLRNVDRIKNENQAGIHPEATRDPELACPNGTGRVSGSNPEAETKKQIRLSLFKKSQKLIDRFLFIFFAEDRGLLPPNSIHRILTDWNKLKELDAVMPLYDRFKLYFSYLDTGRKGTDTKAEIFAYNGGLFKPDPILDTIEIDDELLYKHASQLAKYDFESQVDVNILGHIFENSLNEVEEVENRILKEDEDESGSSPSARPGGASKRKKDGVFYTPKYITKYIVENTVGRLCEEKKSELGFREEEYYRGRKQRQTNTVKALIKILDDYREWLLKLTICDPACGSGAFLNQALDFLIKEHQYIDEMKAKLLGGGLIFSDIETTILENNIYGVDINEESVEIAKLSLWLRTAQPRRKLNDLSSNIKCGNSLIDDKEVAGDKAFKWEEEFPEVFADGGFDVVIGNPPYLRVQGLKENFDKEVVFYEKEFKTATGRFDIYVLFIEKSLSLINFEGEISFILPHNFLNASFGTGIREFLRENKYLKNLIHFGSNKVFENVSTYTCIIQLTLNNEYINFTSINPSEIVNSIDFDKVEYEQLNSQEWNLISQVKFNLFYKLKEGKKTVSEIFTNVSRGVVTGADSIFIMEGNFLGDEFEGFSKELNTTIRIEKNLVYPILMGGSLKRYAPVQNELFLLYPHKLERKTIPYEEKELEKLFPKTYSYLMNFKDLLVEKKVKYKTNPKYWYGLHNSRDVSIFKTQKIITPYLANQGEMSLDIDQEFFTNDKCSNLILNQPSLKKYQFYLGILNSKLLWFYISLTSAEYSGGYFAFTSSYLNSFPVPEKESPDVIEKVILQQENKKQLIHLGSRFEIFFEKNNALLILSKKLQSWYELEFSEFIKELNKAIKSSNKERAKEAANGVASSGVEMPQLTKKDEFEWMELFEENKKKAQELQLEIEKTDREIDRMVYELYGLTEEEIQIVENK